MFIPIIVGLFTASLYTFFLWIQKQHLAQHAATSVFFLLIPIFLGIILFFFDFVFRAERRHSLADIFESFYFGNFISEPIRWFIRGIVSFFAAITLAIVGPESFLIEWGESFFSIISKRFKLFVEDKQVIVASLISSAIGLVLGAPLSGIILSMEMIGLAEARIRSGAVLASIVSYGTSSLLFRAFLGPDSDIDRFSFYTNLLSSSLAQNRSVDIKQWVWFAVGCVTLGTAIAFLCALNNRFLVRGQEFFAGFFSKVPYLKYLVTGILLSFCIYFTPEPFHFFSSQVRLASDLSWLNISNDQALIALICLWVAQVLVFSGWGSSGVFIPQLIMGALLGYLYGNFLTEISSYPLTVGLMIVGSASVFAGTFRAPVAALALVTEVGQDAGLWALTALAVIAVHLFSKKYSPLHYRLLEKFGFRIVEGKIANILSKLKNADAMDTDWAAVTEGMPFDVFKATVHSTRHHFLPVLSQSGNYLGLIALETLPRKVRLALSFQAGSREMEAVERVYDLLELMDPYYPTVLPHSTLDTSLHILQTSPCLPVVDESRKFRGFLYESQILGRYKNEMTGVSVRKF